MQNYWIFSNNYEGSYDDSDWDTSTILNTKKYYFKQSEPNRSKVKKGDRVILREYGKGFWGACEIEGDWVTDPQGVNKYKTETGWFPINNINKWNVTLPYEIIKSELSNQNHRLRIIQATEEDKNKIELSIRLYLNLGYGSSEGDFFILEKGIEEAVKTNLSQIGLTLAENEIQQQCNLGIGIGRTDLICRDNEGNYVVIELKAVKTSDIVIGQVLRYMGFIRETWAEKEGKDVKGIILTPGYDEQLRYAAKEAGIKVLKFRII
ncbi:MAG: endonuclease NucS domain-containing protein [Candidatus Scalindua sp.]